MHKLTEKESSILEGYNFDVSFLTYGEVKECLVFLCERSGMGLVEEIGSQYNAFLIELTLPRIKQKQIAVKAIVEWQRNKGYPILSLTWTEDVVADYLSSNREGKSAYEKIFQKMVGNLLTEWRLVY